MQDDNTSTAAAAGPALSEGLGPLPEPDIVHFEFGTPLGYSRETLLALLAAERERLLTLAKRRAAYEASAAAQHVMWHAAHEHHLTRHAAMRDLIDVLEGPNVF